MATLQEQARALGDPTRHDIFRYVADAAEPVGVAELTEHFGLNHNAIRQHLAKLVEADLIIEGKAASTRGRPRLTYVLDPTVDSRWGVEGPYERLAVLLSEVIRTGDSPVEVGRRAGRRMRYPTSATPGSSTGAADPARELSEQMAWQGFEPVLTHRGDEIDVSLNACPFESAAVTNPDTVCGLHLGIALGMAESIGGLTVDELVPKDPRRAHCRLRYRIEPYESTG